jgi:hypothetical protein
VIDSYLDHNTAGRKLKEPASSNALENEESESVLKKTSRTLNKDGGAKIVHEIKVDESFKK